LKKIILPEHRLNCSRADSRTQNGRNQIRVKDAPQFCANVGLAVLRHCEINRKNTDSLLELIVALTGLELTYGIIRPIVADADGDRIGPGLQLESACPTEGQHVSGL
jgi:hypothetical protein